MINFPNLALNFDVTKDNHGHAYYAASRKALQYTLLSKVNYQPECPNPLPGFHVRVKEIGGNFLLNIVHGRRGVHSCEPLLDLRDNGRKANQLNRIAAMKVNNTEPECLKVLHSHAQLASWVCHHSAQDCGIRAMNVIGNHSLYDVTLTDLYRALDNSSCLTAAFS